MRDLFAGLRTEMTPGDEPVTQARMAEIHKQAAKLAELAQQRDEGP